jgi:hypothetical protein
MSALSIQPVYPIFTDIDGQPLEDGFVWIGQANLDPQGNPITVYWDAALTIPAGQPIRTRGGYPVNSGTPARLYVNSDYSIRVMNRNGSTVYSAPVATERYSEAVITGVDASQVTYTAAGAGAVQTTVQSVLRRQINVQDFGVLPGAANAITNCDNYANLATYVNSLGGNCEIVWPGADDPYEFTAYLNPTYNGTPNLWRGAVQLVDVKNCYHTGYGATAKFNMNPAWYRGNPNVASLDESVFQFRASAAQGDCDHVGVKGLRIEATATLPAAGGLGYADGAAMGVIYRGCTNTLTENVTCYLWGTDGLYFGTAYGDAFGGYGHTVINPVMIANYRQGISVVRNDDGTIIGGEIRDTNGSSFGHAIDWEPNNGNTQTNWTVINIKTRNNQRGAFNFINTRNVRIINADVDEQAASTAGAIYIDGSNVAGYNVEEIVFDGGQYIAGQAVLYVSGGAAIDGGITNIRFINGAYLSSVGAALNNSACLRINPFAAGTTPGYIGDFYIENCVIDGNGGTRVGSGGIGTARLFIKDTEWNLRNPAATALSFGISTPSSYELHMDGVEMTIDPANTLAPYTVPVFAGSLKNCTLSGHASATIIWEDKGVSSTFRIGYNEFSTYNYYNGPTNGLDLTGPGAVQIDGFSGDFGAPFRIVHGGRERVEEYLATPGVFTGQQAPVDGDITFSVGNSGATISNEIFVYNDTLGWRQIGAQTYIGTTPNRPSVTSTASAQIGLLYLDTTLAAAGKPIWFNGTNWVDATGAVV